jgi:DNA polymerase-3 subunit gamma/tau
MATLYRQYRPQRFADVVGQEHITETLQKAILASKVAHAYLFHGPRGTGKTTTARILAHRLNCQQPQGAEPCGTCATCSAARENRLLDVIEIDAASNRGIDDIRALQEGLALNPSYGTYKIYIIDEVHMLTKEAFTALLKTLEEPAKYVVFVLASTEWHKIPETVISRCQVFHFRRASEESMQKRLRYLLGQEKREVAPDALAFIIARSDGCYRDAESLLGQALTLQEGIITHAQLSDFLGLPPQELINRFLTALVRGESAGALSASDQVATLGFDPEQFIQESIRAARDGALALIKQEKPTDAPAWQTEPNALLTLPRIIRALVQAMQDLAYVPEPSIALHLAIVTVCTTQGKQELRLPAGQAGIKDQESATITVPKQQLSAQKPAPTTAKSQLPATHYQLQTIIKLWPKLIEKVKVENPVAATFLRALKPTSWREEIVEVEAHYSLHRSFFEREDNQELVDTSLSELVGSPITVRCILKERNHGTPYSSAPSQRQEHEQDLISVVKEVFGQ